MLVPIPIKKQILRGILKNVPNLTANISQENLFWLIWRICQQYFVQDYPRKHSLIFNSSHIPWNLYLMYVLAYQKTHSFVNLILWSTEFQQNSKPIHFEKTILSLKLSIRTILEVAKVVTVFMKRFWDFDFSGKNWWLLGFLCFFKEIIV